MSLSSVVDQYPGRLAWGLDDVTHLRVTQPSVVKASGTPGLTKRSGMVSLDLPEGTVPTLPNGVGDHHITLAYLGSDVSDEQLEAALNLVRAAAPQHEPLTVRLGGIASFPPSASSDGLVPAYVPVTRSQELSSLREALSDLDQSGRPEWHPHVTLTYLNEGDPLPPPAPTAEFQAGHVSVHVGDRVWRVPLGAAAVRKVYGVSLTLGGFIGKVGAEGYIHGFICVRPPCGKGDHAKVTRDAANGKVYLGEKGTGEYIGKIVKNADGTYTARHNGHIIGGGKTLLAGKYADHQKAAVALGQYHSMRAMEQSAVKSGDYETASHLGAAATAHAGGDAENAVFNLHQAHQGSKAGSGLSHHISLLHQGMGGKPAEFPKHPTSDAELESALKPTWEEVGIPKPSAPSHPGKFISPHDIVETNDGVVVQVNDKKTGDLIGTYHKNKLTGNYNAEHVDGTVIGGNANQDEALDALLAYHNDKMAHKPAVPAKPLGLQVVDSIQMGKVEPQNLSTEQLQAAKQWMHQDAVKDAESYIGGPNPEKDAVEALSHPDHANNDTWIAVNAELTKRGAPTYLPGELKPAKKTAAAPPNPGYEKVGQIDGPHDVSINFATNQVTHLPTGEVIGTAKGTADGYHITHADGTDLATAPNSYDAKKDLIAYHNAHHGDGSTPPAAPVSLKPVTAAHMAAHAAPKPTTAATPWNKAGQVDVQDLSLKQNGDVVHKPTKTVIGHIDKQPNTPKPGTTTFTATHADGTQTHVGVYKGNAMASLALHHNEQVSKPSVPAGTFTKTYTSIGAIKPSEIAPSGVDDFVHQPTGVKVGSVVPGMPGVFQHADGTKVTVPMGGTGKEALAKYHNDHYAGGTVSPATTPSWAKAGHINSLSEIYIQSTGKGPTSIYHSATKEKIGEYHAIGIGQVIARHADNTTLGEHSSGTDAVHAVITHHNALIADLGGDSTPVFTPSVKPNFTGYPAAKKTAAPVPTPPTPTAWKKAGAHLIQASVTAKTNGDVVDKKTKAKIGVVYKTPDSYWTAAHQDGQGFAKYVKKSDALEKLTAYHNQSVAIDKGVKKGDPKLKDLDLLPQGAFYQAKLGDAANGYHVTNVNNGKDYGSLAPDDGGFKATLANGTTFHIPSADATKAKYNFLYAHNQAVGVATGQPVKKLTAHPAMDDGVGFSEHTEVGAKAASLTTASAGVSHSAAATASTSVGHVKHTLAADHTVTETAAIKKYTGSWYATINKAIAAKQLAGDQVPAGVSGAALHHALNKTELAHDTTLHRGIHDAHAMLGPVGSKVGTVDIQHSFMSTSTKPSVAKSFGHGGVVLTIHAPKGAKAMNVVNLSHYSGESEVLFQHGTMYKVNSDEIGSDGLRRADITIVGLSAKDGDHTVYPKMGASGE